MTNQHTNPAVVVTGASRGLGAAMARHLVAEGYTVFAGMRRPADSTTPGSIPLQLDVTDRQSLRAAAATVAERLEGKGLHALVNNAAVLEAGPLELADNGSISRHLDTNIAGPLATIQAFLPALRAGRGRIVNISTINAVLPLPFWGLYSASKAALDALSHALRLELAPTGITVSLLTLGAFATDIRRNALDTWPASDRYRQARATMEALVAMFDATAVDPAIVATAVAELLRSTQPAAHTAVGDGIDDLLALASQPAEVRDTALTQLLDAALPAAPPA